jgi:hypothetical protein
MLLRYSLPLATWLAAPVWVSASPIPLVEYLFNETGVLAPSTGADSSAAATLGLFNSANVPTDLHGAAGSGVGGDLAGHALFGLDRAFDNSAATAMGNAGTGGLAVTPADLQTVDALPAFTLSGWFKTAGAAGISGFARLVVDELSNQGLHLLGGDLAGELRPKVDATELSTPDVQGFGDTQTWVFFAFTYDGSLASNNARFYKGYRQASESGLSPFAVTLMETRSINSGPVADNTTPLQIGNRIGFDRPFDGYLDNLRIHGQALTLTELEGLREGDVRLIPEPGTAGLFVLGLLALRAGRRFRP